jgi:hypothetical protein
MAFNVVRLGLARAHGKSIFTSPKYGSAWSLLDLSEIKAQHTKFVKNLKAEPYGTFDALRDLVGHDQATIMAKTNLLKYPRLQLPTSKRKFSSSVASSSKDRSVIEISDDDNGDDDERMEAEF